MPDLRESTASVVVLGHMNPLIFQPEWLRANGLIGQSEADSARDAESIEVMHREVTALKLSHMQLVVERERFSLTVLEEPLVRAKDFSVGCFNLLGHTPVRAVGLNRTFVFRAPNKASQHALGDLLAPKLPWVSLLGDPKEERTGGLRSITMERSKRADEWKGYIRVTVEALDSVEPDTKILVNDHFVLSTEDGPSAATEATKIIDKQWEISMKRADEISRALMGVVDGA